jgi:hypothetical protein
VDSESKNHPPTAMATASLPWSPCREHAYLACYVSRSHPVATSRLPCTLTLTRRAYPATHTQLTLRLPCSYPVSRPYGSQPRLPCDHTRVTPRLPCSPEDHTPLTPRLPCDLPCSRACACRLKLVKSPRRARQLGRRRRAQQAYPVRARQYHIPVTP